MFWPIQVDGLHGTFLSTYPYDWGGKITYRGIILKGKGMSYGKTKTKLYLAT